MHTMVVLIVLYVGIIENLQSKVVANFPDREKERERERRKHVMRFGWKTADQNRNKFNRGTNG